MIKILNKDDFDDMLDAIFDFTKSIDDAKNKKDNISHLTYDSFIMTAFAEVEQMEKIRKNPAIFAHMEYSSDTNAITEVHNSIVSHNIKDLLNYIWEMGEHINSPLLRWVFVVFCISTLQPFNVWAINRDVAMVYLNSYLFDDKNTLQLCFYDYVDSLPLRSFDNISDSKKRYIRFLNEIKNKIEDIKSLPF